MTGEAPLKPNLENLPKPLDAPSASPSPEAPHDAPEKPVSPAVARTSLEKIAAGPPPEEAGQGEQAKQETQTMPEKPSDQTETPTNATAELGPKREDVNKILGQSSQLLLDTGDHRVLLAALAKETAPTPLGNELRRDTLRMIAELKGDKMTPEQQGALTQLQKDIESLNLPASDPANSEFAKFLETYGKEHPDKAVSPQLIEAIRTNKTDAAPVMAQVLQSDTGLSAALWGEMKGENQTAPMVTSPEALIKTAGLEESPENLAKAQKLFTPERIKQPVNVMDMVTPALMGSAMLIMMLSQLAAGEGGQSPGH